MSKRRSTQLSSSHDVREHKRLLIIPDSGPIPGSKSNEVKFSNQEQSTTSSVGSNNPVLEVITLFDDDDDDDGVVESQPSKIDVPGDKSETLKSEFTDFGWLDGEEDEQGNWIERYGSMIVDDNGFLVGEFRRLDEELYISVIAD